MKRIAAALACVAVLGIACGNEDAAEPTEPAPEEVEATSGGGTMDDQDLDY